MNSKTEELRLVTVIAQLARGPKVTVVGTLSDKALADLRGNGFQVFVSSDGSAIGNPPGAVIIQQPELLQGRWHMLEHAELAAVFCSEAEAVARAEECLRSSGFRTHPRLFKYSSCSSPGREWPLFIAQPRTPSSQGLLSEPIEKSAPSLKRLSFLSLFVRPGDRVQVIGGDNDERDVLRAATTCTVEDGCDGPRDFSLYSATSFSKDDLAREAAKAAVQLTPGGRFVSVFPILGIQEATSVAAAAIRDAKLVVEKIFVQGLHPSCLRDVTDVDQPTGDWCIIVAAIDPITTSGGVRFKDTIYPYPDPTRNLLAFSRDYGNPWLMRSVFGMSVRTENRAARLDAARRVESASTHIDADRGSAICVLGYDILSAGSATEKTVFLVSAERYLDEPAESPHALRWQVSICFLCAVMLQDLGMLDEAVGMYRRTLEMPWLEFSPTLGTKPAEAAYRAGMILFRRGDIEGARSFWKMGVQVAREIIGSPFEEIVGDEDCPLPDALPETLHALSLARRSADCLRLTHPSQPGDPLYRMHALSPPNEATAVAARLAELEDENRRLRGQIEAAETRPSVSIGSKGGRLIRWLRRCGSRR
jgi:hypothetical protein